jgi:hypothetical protein
LPILQLAVGNLDKGFKLDILQSYFITPAQKVGAAAITQLHLQEALRVLREEIKPRLENACLNNAKPAASVIFKQKKDNILPKKCRFKKRLVISRTGKK